MAVGPNASFEAKAAKRETFPAPLLKVTDVARLLQVTPAFVYRHASELGAFKVGRHLRFSLDRIGLWLKSQQLKESNSELYQPLGPPQTVLRDWMSPPLGIRKEKRPTGRRTDNGGS
jgi:Helix-turn-helix domain